MGRRTGPSREPDGGAALPAAPTDDDLCASARELGADGGADVLVASMTSAVRVLESCVHGRVVLVTRAGCGHRPVLDPHSFGGATPERLAQRRGLRGKLHLASDRFHLWSGLKGGDCIGDLGITHGGDPGECFATERTRQLSGGSRCAHGDMALARIVSVSDLSTIRIDGSDRQLRTAGRRLRCFQSALQPSGCPRRRSWWAIEPRHASALADPQC